MPDSDSHDQRVSPEFPEAEAIGPHLVITKTDWVPGDPPTPQHREPRRTGYFETYFRCIRCGLETIRKTDFPPDCDHGEGRA